MSAEGEALNAVLGKMHLSGENQSPRFATWVSVAWNLGDPLSCPRSLSSQLSVKGCGH